MRNKINMHSTVVDVCGASINSSNIFKITKSSTIAFIITVAIVTNYIYGISGVGFFDDLLNIVIISWSVVATIINPGLSKRYLLLWFFFLVFLLLAVLFLYQSPAAFVYEFYKLFLFLAFVPLLAYSSKLTVIRADEKILNFLSLFMMFNLVIICFQYLISPDIVTYFGLPIEQITMSSKSGRWVGLFESVNSLGDSAVLLYFLNDFIRPKSYKIFRFVFFISVVVSTSKHAVILLILMVVFLGIDPSRARVRFISHLRRSFFVVTFALLISGVTYHLNESAFVAKFNQYQYFINNVNDITESDARFIEKRALNIGFGLSIFQDYPLGVGLGVWGDSSSRFNTKSYPFPEVEMSDSSVVHMLVEQGWFIVFYFLVLFSGVILARKYGNMRYFLILLLTLLSIDIVTMGLSSGSWPLLFAYIYARLLKGGRNITA